LNKQVNLKLKLNWKPSPFHYKTVRKSISQTLWKKIRVQVLDAENKTCNTCGFVPIIEEDVKKLHVHELEEYVITGGNEQLCILKGLNLICEKCHAFHHWGRTVGVLSKEKIDSLIEHFLDVNQCTMDDFMTHYREVKEGKRTEFLKLLKQPKKVPDMRNLVVKFTIEGEIPYKQEVIMQLDKKGLYK
jgi:5-methylcytosine-specific restriction endonuclease McrA